MVRFNVWVENRELTMKEYILCAAIWYKDFPLANYQPKNVDRGVVLCGHRHAGIIAQHVTLMGKRAAEMGEYEQGFITSENRFIDRKEGMKIASDGGQVLSYNSGQLYSEDLY